MATKPQEPTAEKNLDGHGAAPIPWERVRNQLDQKVTQAPDAGGPNRHTCWLTTLDADGRPHVVAVGAVWVDGAFYFKSGPGTRKSKNLARDPRCAMSVATHNFDLVFEGTAAPVTDPTVVERVVEEFRAGGWPASVTEDGVTIRADYSATTAGPPPWNVYLITAETVYALGTSEPGGAERWQF